VTGIFVTLAVAACTKDARREATPPVDGMITLKVEIPRAYTDSAFPGSRADGPVAGTAEESRVNHLRFFVFKSDRDSLECYAEATIKDDGTSTSPAWDAANQSLRVVVAPGPKRVYCVANWAATPTAEMPELTDQTIADTASLVARTRVHAGVSPTNPPVMSGRMTRLLTGKEESISIPLTRQVARVGISPVLSRTMQDRARIEIDGVKFKRLPRESLVFESTSRQAPLPVGSWHESAFRGASGVRVLDSVTRYPTYFYVPENTTMTAANATLMIIKARYEGVATYYAMTLNRTPPTGQPAFTLTRNYYYNYILTIAGKGSDAEPTNAPSRGGDEPAFANIRCERVEAW
jgi:hypothetical protein